MVAPIWDYWDTSRLKRSPDSAHKLRYYKTVTGWLWSASIVAVLAAGIRPLMTIATSAQDVPWLFLHRWVRYALEALLVGFCLVTLLPLVTVFWKKMKKTPRTWRTADALKPLSWFLPATWSERRWFAFVCITAGICEETLFRGFLLHYLHVSGFSLNLTLALLLSSGIFGLQHFYLGIGGTVFSIIAGLILGLLFLMTGTLIVPMVLHAVMDLRMLALLRPPAIDSASAA